MDNLIIFPPRTIKSEQDWFNLHVDQILAGLEPLSRDAALMFLEDFKFYADILESLKDQSIVTVFFDYKDEVMDQMETFDFAYDQDPLTLLLNNQIALFGLKRVVRMVNSYLNYKKDENKKRRQNLQ